MKRIGQTELEVSPLCLGCNVFGWTAGEPESFAVLDAYADAGGNFIDAADSCPQWIVGSHGGESETIIGPRLSRRGRRGDLIIATKVGQSRHHTGPSPANIWSSAKTSLRRLGSGHMSAAAAYYREPDGSYRAYGIVVLTATTSGIARLVVFANPGLFDWCGLPQTHD